MHLTQIDEKITAYIYHFERGLVSKCSKLQENNYSIYMLIENASNNRNKFHFLVSLGYFPFHTFIGAHNYIVKYRILSKNAIIYLNQCLTLSFIKKAESISL